MEYYLVGNKIELYLEYMKNSKLRSHVKRCSSEWLKLKMDCVNAHILLSGM